ncbi:class II fructose-bisphosphate aldolase [Vibrio breoganii]|uniref:class II fructose-bisphosphate aldolase n=1 Tax=Vibrio breoganii TaxID=553239 RepID=UPI000CB3DB61|nr:class II fructose-bisphosphate aldolase [Vibrio breoganii]PML13808.1 hypothetical protein BCT84_12510 [Vibrio breoganii]
MLVTTKRMLSNASKQGFAIPSANLVDFLTAKSYAEVAAQLQKPLILSMPSCHLEHFGLKEAAITAFLLSDIYDAQMALHLDACHDFEVIKEAIELGFTSVMLDASMDDFETNASRTKAVVDYAHQHGVTVEGKIGGHHRPITDPAEAREFTQITGVDSLRIHINQAQDINSDPALINFEQLKAIRNEVSIPLTMNANALSGYENLTKCAELGIAKVHIFSDFMRAGTQAAKTGDYSNYLEMKKAIATQIGRTLSNYYQVLLTETN